MSNNTSYNLIYTKAQYIQELTEINKLENNEIKGDMPIAIEIKEHKEIIHINPTTPVIATRINDEISPEILAAQMDGDKCQLYQYCLVVPLGLLSIILIVYYSI